MLSKVINNYQSFCYLANVFGKKGEPSFTQKELNGGFEIKWVSLDEAIKLLKADKPDGYDGMYIQIRDLIFLANIEKHGYDMIKEKFDWMYNRITSDTAKKIGKPFYDKMISDLEKLK